MSSRYFNSKFWRDSYVDGLDPSEKLMFIHLFTNPEANICGVYEIPERIMSSDTGFNHDMLKKILARFKKDKKAFYVDGWVCTVNTIKYQNLKNRNTRKGVERALDAVPSKIMKKFIDLAGYDFTEIVPDYVHAREEPEEPKEVAVVEYPEWLNVKAWEEWVDYRTKHKKKKITEAAKVKQWNKLKKLSFEEQQDMIDHSIENDYQGLFPRNKSSLNKKFHVA